LSSLLKGKKRHLEIFGGDSLLRQRFNRDALALNQRLDTWERYSFTHLMNIEGGTSGAVHTRSKVWRDEDAK